MGKVPATLREVTVQRKTLCSWWHGWKVKDIQVEMIMCLTWLLHDDDDDTLFTCILQLPTCKYCYYDSFAFLINMVLKILCMDLMANVCKLLIKPNHISYLRGVTDTRLTLIFATAEPLFQNAATSIHFNQHCLIEIIDFCPLLHKWKTLVIKHFVSKSKFRDPHQHLRKIGNSLKKKKKKEVAKMWKEEAGNEIMNGVRVSYLSQAERH